MVKDNVNHVFEIGGGVQKKNKTHSGSAFQRKVPNTKNTEPDCSSPFLADKKRKGRKKTEHSKENLEKIDSKYSVSGCYTLAVIKKGDEVLVDGKKAKVDETDRVGPIVTAKMEDGRVVEKDVEGKLRQMSDSKRVGFSLSEKSMPYRMVNNQVPDSLLHEYIQKEFSNKEPDFEFSYSSSQGRTVESQVYKKGNHYFIQSEDGKNLCYSSEEELVNYLTDKLSENNGKIKEDRIGLFDSKNNSKLLANTI